MGFHDFAGSTIVHSLGGWAALVGAAVIGPRIGKYGKNGESHAIPGHSITLGALGVFILWFGWFGFNPGSTLSGMDVESIAHIFVTTNLCAAAAAVSAMVITWVRYKRPDVSMTLNGALAGLVTITAGCDIVAPWAAVVMGLLAGLVMVGGIEFIDKVLKIDDPVGASTVHGLSGVFGTLCVGLFATEGGLFYGGGIELLKVQIIGIVVVAAWTLITTFILFKAIKAAGLLRVSADEENEGLDINEHGIDSYADFQSRAHVL
jgi:Amt family ammonium transporter